MTLRGVDFTGIAYLVGFAVVGVVAWQLYKHRADIGKAVNPLDSGNVANRGVSSIVQGVTGGAAAGGEDSLGGLIARAIEKVSGTTAKIEAMKTVTQDPAAGSWEDRLRRAANDPGDNVFMYGVGL